jgi:drug/metabolite transporter (DMT)-like permease
MRHVQDVWRAALFVAASELMFASMGAAVKAASAQLPNEVVVFFRNLFGLMALVPWLLRGGLEGLQTEALGLHLLRSLAGLAAMYCFFYSIAHLGLAEAVLVALASPFFIPVIAAAWLGEAVPGRVRWAIPLGFLGVLLILRPGSAVFAWAGVVGLAGAAFAALAKVTIRRLSRTESTTRIVFYFGVIATAASALPLSWAWHTPSPAMWSVLAAGGVFATAGQLLLTRAYATAPAARIGPVTYVAVIFSSLLGWLLWGETLGALGLAGAVLVCCAGMLTTAMRAATTRDALLGVAPLPGRAAAVGDAPASMG